jgi:hypothetical protein
VAPEPMVGDKGKPETIVQDKKDDGATGRDGSGKQKDVAHA